MRQNTRTKLKKRLLSMLLSLTMIVSGITPAFAAGEEGNSTLNPLVAVIEKVTSGDELNLTEEGALDWVHISGQRINRKKDVQEVIGFENVTGEDIQPVGDSPMLYTWTDGNLDETSSRAPKAGAFMYKRGDEESVGKPIAGKTFKITLPAADETRMLTFVSGIWQATATFQICVNGEETPVYTTELKAGGEAPVKKYTLVIREHNAVEVTAIITEKTHFDGNMSLGGIALKSAEPSPISVKVQDAVNGRTMNLTERGDEDWIHFEGDDGTVNYKAAPVTPPEPAVRPIEYEKLSDDKATTMHDARISYSWSDGTPDEVVENNTSGAVFNYKNGDESSVGSPLTEPAGYKMKIAAAPYERELVFVSGVWNSNAEISIILDGESKPVYENKELMAGGDVVNKVYTVTIAENKGLTVTGTIKQKNHPFGNFNLQAAALSRNQTLNDFEAQLKEMLQECKGLNLGDYEEFYANQLEAEITNAETLVQSGTASNGEYYIAYLFLSQAYESCLKSELDGRYTFESNSGLTSSFGWEGDKDAPIAYLDGSYKLRDNGNTMITFGVRDIPGKIKWYNAEGYLPCFISEYSKDGMDYKVENFANKHTMNDHDYEIAYSRITVENKTEEEQRLPVVSSQLIALNDAARTAKRIGAGETVVREYAIGADRFGGTYEYPAAEEIAAQGGFDENYTEMKNYWNTRLEPLSEITSLPNQELINAYKAGFIYTLIIRDDVNGQKQLHVGENGYDIMFDHDTIGIVASLLTIGDFTYAKEYLATLPAQLQYDDAKWKYSWPYAIYLQKTDDIEFIVSKYDVIKKNTHHVETDRDMDAGGIIKRTFAIDSSGYWLIDNWAALAGLTTYRYLCERLNAAAPLEEYQTEITWAENLYDDLLESVEAKQRTMREENNYPYLSIDMTRTTENSERGDARDANWASMFLFGRWAWDGYLFGADQENSEMIGLIDDTYQHGFERRAEISDTIYNFGGYPHGYYSSAYNAGYGSSALRGERYREAGIRAYEFMIEKSMSGPFGWWEGVNYPDENSPWDIDHARGGGGSCQHMWGQSTATKVLYDALIAEKLGEKVIIGRGIPKEWLAEGEAPVEIKNYLVEGAKKAGYKMTTTGSQITVEFTGETLTIPYSIELITLKDNISGVTVDGNAQTENINKEAGTVLVPAGTKNVVITLEESIEPVDKSALEEAIQAAEAKDLTGYTEESVQAFQAAIAAAKAVFEKADATEQEVSDAIAALAKAEEGLKKPGQPEKPDKSKLEEAIQAAEAKDLSIYTEESVEAYKAAIAAAKAIVEKEDATDQEVSDAIAALAKAEEGLKKPGQPEKPDKSKLEEAIQAAEAKDLSIYTEESVEAYKAAIAAAKAIVEKEDATEQEISDAIAALAKAEEGLKRKDEPQKPDNPNLPSKETLAQADKAIKDAEAANLSGYTEESAKAYRDAIWAVKNVLAKKDATEAEVKAALAALAKAKEGLKVKVEGGTNQEVKVSSIKLSAASKKIAAGKKVTVKAAVSPATASNKTVTFSTSNKKYATVSAKGVVTTKKAGAGKTVTITAQAKDGSGKKASIKIKIMKGVVKKIKLKAAKTVKAGKKVTVKATVTATKNANKTLVYSVNNKKYASVNIKGVVTAKKAGKGKTVTVTAKSTDGSNKKATVRIRIK
ncbi:MAG: hypothetical protein HFJ04_09710 [Lachnospiraceae bacterium]|nr:hypothetical protein [Lachnospiraceae bacterium]